VADAKRHAKQSSENVFYVSPQLNSPVQNCSRLAYSPSIRSHKRFDHAISQLVKEDALAEFK